MPRATRLPSAAFATLDVQLRGRRGALASAGCTTRSAQSGSSLLPPLATRRRLARLLCKFAGLELSCYGMKPQPANLRGGSGELKPTSCIRRGGWHEREGGAAAAAVAPHSQCKLHRNPDSGLATLLEMERPPPAPAAAAPSMPAASLAPRSLRRANPLSELDYEAAFRSRCAPRRPGPAHAPAQHARHTIPLRACWRPQVACRRADA